MRWESFSVTGRTNCLQLSLIHIQMCIRDRLTVARNHDVAYLNGIFEMKNAETPLFVSQPYIYVANNYEYFNCLVRDLTQHSYGLLMLFPVLALTGLKFVFPQLTSWPMFITKAELTTITLFYDAYYDFGLIGVFLFGLILGAVCAALTQKIRKSNNPILYLFYAQLALYLALSFFSSWFTVPTTWFWFALTGALLSLIHILKLRQNQFDYSR